MKKIDFKKELKHLYNPSPKKIEIVDVPQMNFLTVDGEGNPNTSKTYRDAIEVLFGLSYTLKFMIKKGPTQTDYGVMPLEGLWWAEDMAQFSAENKDNWKWKAMIMQPKYVTKDLFVRAKDVFNNKTDSAILDKVIFEPISEGKAAQTLYIGPFSEEGPTIEKLHKFIFESGFTTHGKHHEIYLSDLRRTAPEKWKTIIRQPMAG